MSRSGCSHFRNERWVFVLNVRTTESAPRGIFSLNLHVLLRPNMPCGALSAVLTFTMKDEFIFEPDPIYIGSGSRETKLFPWDQHFLHETSHQNTLKVKKANIHSKNTVNVTFTEFFNVKVRKKIYLHNIFAVKVSIFLPCFAFFYLDSVL